MKNQFIFPKEFKLIYFIKPIKWHFALGLFLSIFAALSNFGLLFLSGWLITSAAVAGLAGVAAAQAFNIMLPAAGVRFFAMARILSRYLERVITHDGAFRLTSALRTAVYAFLIPQTPSGLLDKRGGDILGQFVSDTESVSAYYTDAVVPFGRAFFCSIIFVGLVFYFLPIAGMALLIALLLAGVLVPLITYFISYSILKKMRIVKSVMQANLAEILQNLGELLTLNILDYSIDKVKQDQITLDQSKLKLDFIESAARNVITMIMMAVVLSILIQSFDAYQHHALMAAEIPMLVLGVMAAFDVILPLPTACHAKIKANIAEKQLQASCDNQHIRSTQLKSLMPIAPYDLVIDKVSFGYPSQPEMILNHASLNIKQGDHIAIIGESGVGKTSLINMLFSFYPLQLGRICFGGQDVREMTSETLSQFITVISQDFHLFSGTIRENLQFITPHVTDSEINEALKVVQLEEFIYKLPQGIDTFIGNDGIRLSGGQARRLAIAQGILRKTSWLILDEPTDGLDIETEYELIQTLLKIYINKTVVIITHKMEILRLVNKVVLLQEGEFYGKI